MTRIEALKALLEKVEAGEWGGSYESLRLAGLSNNCFGLNKSGDFWSAYRGSLDAAKALHEAVLHERAFVEIQWSKRYDEECRVTINMGNEGWVSASNNPSRAWLTAILKALIAQEESA